jgi:putative iron-regulated protein
MNFLVKPTWTRACIAFATANTVLAALALCSTTALACAVFSAPVTYRNPSALIDFDAHPQANAVRKLAFLTYQHATRDAQALEVAIDALLAKPNATTLAAARMAWKIGKASYQRTEWTRFADTPIDWPALGARPAGPELRLNAWPLNEAVIDYVKGAADAGLVHRFDLPMTAANILASDQVGDESDVTTGWHAIEFLLWGQDFSATGAGNRPAADFALTDSSHQRRRDYLKLLVRMLVADLTTVRNEWDPADPESYASKLSQLPAIEQLGRALQGATSLVMIELYGQRLTTALDSRSQEDEHSCFSDFTLEDLKADLAGIDAVLYAKDNDAPESSLLALLKWKNPDLANRLVAQLALATTSLSEVPAPFDQIIVSPEAAPGRKAAERAAIALQSLGVTLKACAESLGIQVVVPGV